MATTQEELKRKIILMMTFRMVIIITLLGSAILIQLVSRTILPINPLYFLIFLTSFFTLISAMAFGKLENLRLLAYLQLTGDVVVVTLLLYFTGSARSPFSFLFILLIIAASIILYRRGSLYIASISSILYGVMVELLYYGVIPYYDMQPWEISEISIGVINYYIFIHIFGFYTTAMLSSYLSERLRTTSTELQEMDEDLSDLKILHQKVIDSMSTGLIIADLELRVNFVNPAGLQIFGMPNHLVIDKEMSAMFAEELNTDVVRESLDRSKFLRVERSIRRGGETIMIGMTLSYLHTLGGIPYGMIALFQDITEIQKMEQQLRIRERMAAIGTMAAGIAHEIRNPLAAIHGSVQMLRDELNLSDDQGKLMEIVLTESMRLHQTIQNFLNYAKPRHLNRGMEDLQLVVSDTLSFIQKSPEFRAGHHISLSSSAEDFTHEFDSNLIKQVIWNLSVNALQAMPDGGTLKVSLGHDLQGAVVLNFQDQGKGIESHRLESIFDPFQKSTSGGTGLGMAIVYRIVQDHQGRITIDSKPGSGTSIIVRLPVRAGVPVQPVLQ